jgi:hypothetical protein
MRAALALVAVLFALGCSRDERSDTTSPTAVQPSAAANANSLRNVPADWDAKRGLGSGAGADPFGAAATTARRAAVQPVQPPSNLMPQRPPFAYVGKVVRGRILYAVMARDDRVFLVRASDTLDAYRVLSVSENEVLLAGGDTGDTYTIPFSPKSGTSAALPLSAVPGVDDASLEVSAPRQVSVGEEFTLTVSLDSGVNAMLETGRVEVRYDPKVLQIAGQSASSGVTKLDIPGAYAGHPMPATLQFRAVAAAPATEIRVIPTSIADTEGRDVGVNTPQPHKLTIVRAAAP